MAAVGGTAFTFRRASTNRIRTTDRNEFGRSIVSAQSRPPLILSTDASHIDVNRLKDLYDVCNLSGHRFPNFDREGKAELIDLKKMKIAVSNSFVVVSVFAKRPPFDDLVDRFTPLTCWNGELVGFGRAVSDSSLTASIHDVMVDPSLRRMGIGRMILKRLVRVLTSKDIYDISALCDEDDRMFFDACGFGDDMMNSTTMMYTRGISTSSGTHDYQVIIKAGRRRLVF